jgi:hypothetical protein
MEGSGLLHALAALQPEKGPPYQLDRRLGRLQSRTIWRSESSWPYRDSNYSLSVVYPVGSRYTEYATTALKYI